MGQKIGRRPQTQLCGDALIPCAAAQGIFVVVDHDSPNVARQGGEILHSGVPQSLPLRGGGAPEGRDGEVCRRCATAARQRPLHRVKPCSKLSVRQHLSVSLREPAPLKGSLPPQATHPQSLPSRGASPLRRRTQSLFLTRDPKEAPCCMLGFCGNRSRFRMRLRGIRFSCGGKFLWLMQAGCILVTTMAYGKVGREGAPGCGGQNGYFL